MNKQSETLSVEDLSLIADNSPFFKTNSDSYNSISTLQAAKHSDIVVFHNPKYKRFLAETKAGVIILKEEYKPLAPKQANLIFSSNPYKAFALIAKQLYAKPHASAYISDRAVIGHEVVLAEGVTVKAGAVIDGKVFIGKGTTVGANAVVTDDVEIGEYCQIGPNATISHAKIGNQTIIYPGVCIGQDGFGFASDSNGHYKIPHIGQVIIGDDVEIGANTCIDRGTIEDTVIGSKCRIDNLVQIGHNVQIGRGSVIVSQVGIAGSAKIGANVTLAGQVGINGHVAIGDGTIVLAQSGVVKDTPPKSKVAGFPAVPYKQWIKNHLKSKK